MAALTCLDLIARDMHSSRLCVERAGAVKLDTDRRVMVTINEWECHTVIDIVISDPDIIDEHLYKNRRISVSHPIHDNSIVREPNIRSRLYQASRIDGAIGNSDITY